MISYHFILELSPRLTYVTGRIFENAALCIKYHEKLKQNVCVGDNEH